MKNLRDYIICTPRSFGFFWVNALILTFAIILLCSPALAAQRNPLGSACGGLLTLLLMISVINIIILVWVARDAKARGTNSVGWLLLVLVTGIVGLIVYIFARPQGELVVCSRCHNKKLAAMVKCPTCGNYSTIQSIRR